MKIVKVSLLLSLFLFTTCTVPEQKTEKAASIQKLLKEVESSGKAFVT